jgi:alkanesulfonate monooxygenase SsuD/methylene tetrahydromethanopterin reductase-like flavin-dependent oxidoreductase (luciferase family)
VSLDLRFGLHFARLPSGEGGHAAYRELLSQGKQAEALGFDSLWVGERSYGPGALAAAFPVCAALASATRRVRIGIAALPLPLHHPLRVAEDAATLDGISGGRFDLGVGLGDDLDGFHGFGIPPGERATRLEESIAVLDRALRGEILDFAGRHFSFSGIRVEPAAVQPDGPPLWIGARADVALQRVVRLGRGLLAPDLEAARSYLATWQREGRDPSQARLVLCSSIPSVEGPTTARVDRGVAEVRDLAAAGSLELLLPAASAESLVRLSELVTELRAALGGEPTRAS